MGTFIHTSSFVNDYIAHVIQMYVLGHCSSFVLHVTSYEYNLWSREVSVNTVCP